MYACVLCVPWKYAYLVGDPRVLERRLHCRFVRVSQQGGIGQPPRVAQIQGGVERLERMLPDGLEERIRLRDVRWRIQDPRSLSRQWFLHRRACLLRVNDISSSGSGVAHRRLYTNFDIYARIARVDRRPIAHGVRVAAVLTEVLNQRPRPGAITVGRTCSARSFSTRAQNQAFTPSS